MENHETQSRLKSPIVWTAVISQLLAMLLALGWIDTGLSDAMNQIAAGVLQLLTLLGVLNNLTDKTGF